MKSIFSWMFILLCITTEAQAGAVEDEIMKLQREQGQAFLAGNLDNLMEHYAENAVLVAAERPFRHDGKQAIRAYYAQLFKDFPTRRGSPEKPSIRLFNDHTVVMHRYQTNTYVDSTGNEKYKEQKRNVAFVWVKMGERWLLTDHIISVLP